MSSVYSGPQASHWAKLLADKNPSSKRLEMVMRSGWVSHLLDDENYIPPIPQRVVDEFPIWKTVQLGLHRSAQAYVQAIQAAEMTTNDSVWNFLSLPAFSCVQKEMEVDLVLLSPKDLGFQKKPTLPQMYEKAKRLGLELCPNEVGLALRLQYTDQTPHQHIHVAIESIMGQGFFVFEVERGALNPYLDCIRDGLNDTWDLDGLWVFVLPRFQPWYTRDGIICLSVTSDGASGVEWIQRSEGRGFRVSDDAKDALQSDDFAPTSNITTQLALLSGNMFNLRERTSDRMIAEASRRYFKKPRPEVACLLRQKFSDSQIKAMGFHCLVVMHQPIKKPDSFRLNLLSVICQQEEPLLDACNENSGLDWGRDVGFVFMISQSRA